MSDLDAVRNQLNASLQVCKYTGMQECKYANMQQKVKVKLSFSHTLLKHFVI